MSYTNLFRAYINPSNRWHNEFVDNKRLRWLKNEALGISKFSTTVFNIRHAHICNRNVQRNLFVQLESNASQHGKFCNELEKKQLQLWRSSKLVKTRFLPPLENINPAELNLPFSSVKEYSVQQLMEKSVLSPPMKIKPGNRGRIDLYRQKKEKKTKTVVITTDPFPSAKDYSVQQLMEKRVLTPPMKDYSVQQLMEKSVLTPPMKDYSVQQLMEKGVLTPPMKKYSVQQLMEKSVLTPPMKDYSVQQLMEKSVLPPMKKYSVQQLMEKSVLTPPKKIKAVNKGKKRKEKKTKTIVINPVAESVR